MGCVTGRATPTGGTAAQMSSTQSVQPTPGISNDASELHVNSNNSSCVGPEAEVVGRSSGAENSGSVGSGTIVEVSSSTPAAAAHHHSANSDHFAADSDMGNAINKSETLAKLSSNAAEIFKTPANDVKRPEQPAATQTERHKSDSAISDLPPSSSNVVNVSDAVPPSERAKETTDADSDVIPTGNPGIPDVRNDVTTSGITREVDDGTRLELTASALTVSQDTVEDLAVDSLDVGLDNVDGEETCGSLAENGPRQQHGGSSAEICSRSEVTDDSGRDAAKPDHRVRSQDNDNTLDRSSSQNDDFSAAPANDR